MNPIIIISTLLGIAVAIGTIVTQWHRFWHWLRQTSELRDCRNEVKELRKIIGDYKQRIKQYENYEEKKKNLEIYKNAVYKHKVSGEFFCIICFDKDKEFIHVTPDGTGWWCHVCGKGYYPPGESPPLIHII